MKSVTIENKDEKTRNNELKDTLMSTYLLSPFYKQHFDKNRINIDKLYKERDVFEYIHDIPFATKEDIRIFGTTSFLAVNINDVIRYHVSSGTSGEPTAMAYTKNDIRDWANLVGRAMSRMGITHEDVIQNTHGYGLFTGGLGIHYGAEALGAAVIPTSTGNTKRQVEIINKLKPTVLVSTPFYLFNILDEMVRQGLDPKQSSINKVIIGGEASSIEIQERIEETLNAQCFVCYGLSEIYGPGVATGTMEDRFNPTLWEDFFYLEIIDPDSGKVLEEGMEGELVLTTLTKDAMPLIRYRTGDITKILPSVTDGFKRIERIKGRADDMLSIRALNVYPRDIESELLKIDQLSTNYHITIDRPRNIDQFKIEVELKPEYKDITDTTPIKHALEDSIMAHYGLTVDIDILPPGYLNKTSEGKSNNVTDKRKK